VTCGGVLPPRSEVRSYASAALKGHDARFTWSGLSFTMFATAVGAEMESSNELDMRRREV
jgi:alpha-D-ribose 1-methylphosphonate 5-triphosphate diphosphatase PhnM